ncbi:hypothetical protein SPOG_05677 [Schizosaccharomyces cryophilus OY26]|uniref:Reverse transcriptase n=1 Tax=Schizosaccharomyces cryophilus (strain OY26 / ATCC MYA-4695 / CBS 11777 / NBRC 106824 / NRRL Y48691) TaxID=653667 RepID=S9VX23_SCHCR|nr:uncharacterized protein SPOG_05677 [Schizosaccharomyces cryophilus OY26]EPY52228.1 hypothetical protein SPOG_05677 [Schizosaccharomyces cryophilus OY26]
MDSGADVSLLREDLAKQITREFDKEDRTFVGITKHILKVTGKLTLPVEIRGRKYHETFTISPSIEEDAIIGWSLIEKMNRLEGLSKIEIKESHDENFKKNEEIQKILKPFSEIFEEPTRTPLPEHSESDLKIELTEELPTYSPKLRPYTQKERECIKEKTDELLKQGRIRRSSSKFLCAPLIVPKKGTDKYRMVVNYKPLNAITKRDKYPIPNFEEIINWLNGARVFSTLDLKDAYHLLRIREGDEYKTAFRTPFGSFEYTVMPFGLTNAPANFQRHINGILHPYNGIFVIIYLDDILIYSSSIEEHRSHVRKVLQKLRQANLYLNAEKCQFFQNRVKFLGHIFSDAGMEVDKERIQAITNWPQPNTLRRLRSFLGFVNYSRRFMPNLSRLARPLYDLTKKNVKFKWTDRHQQAFIQVKQTLENVSILSHYKPGRETLMETDASDYGIGAILSQKQDDEKFHPIAFHSASFTDQQKIWSTWEKEAYAIITSLRKWYHFLADTDKPFKILTDHKNLTSMFTNIRTDTRPKINRWAAELDSYNFEIQYRPGRKNEPADALSRRDDLKTQVINRVLVTDGITNIFDYLRKEYDRHPEFKVILDGINDSSNFLVRNGLIINELGQVVIPKVPQLIQVICNKFHDQPTSGGHRGKISTTNRIREKFYWKGMTVDIQNYVKNCNICQKYKTRNHKQYGYLQPLPIAEKPFSHISMDFITGLPKSQDNDAILTIVDRFTKMAWFIPCNTSVTMDDLIKIFNDRFIGNYGYPTDIVSDRGSVFTSEKWRHFAHSHHINLSLSSGYHPQTNGQTERVNHILENYLRCYINKQSDNWVSYLPQAQLCYNSAQHSATKIAPYTAAFGRPAITNDWDIKMIEETGITLTQDHIYTAEQIHERINHKNKEYAEYYNRKRSRAPVFKQHDLVLVKKGKVGFFHQQHKLDSTYAGPFRVEERVGDHNYTLSFPENIRRRYPSSFHVSELEPFNDDLTYNNFKQTIQIDGILDVDDFKNPYLYLCLYNKRLTNEKFQTTAWIPQDIVHNLAADKLNDFTQRASASQEPQ